jgi:hypothetical protein
MKEQLKYVLSKLLLSHKKNIRILSSMKTQSRIMMNVIIASGNRIKGRRPNVSTSLTDAVVAIRFIIPVEIIPQ